MSKNLEIWNQLKTPPRTAMKEIKAGRLKGMNDINPQWRIMAMTQQFGVCGLGWKYTIDRQWTESAANNEMLAFVNISLYIKDGDKWSEAIPANGGSKLTAKESSGLYNSDEAFKMAFTDALGVAMKMLGMAADVYMGVFDSKNVTPPQGKVAQPTGEVPQPKNDERTEAVKAFSASFNAVPANRKGEAKTISGNSTIEEIKTATAHNIQIMKVGK